MFDLAGRVALVTGAGQGIGTGIARALGLRGAAVVVNDLHSERAAAAADELGRAGIVAAPAAFDVVNYDAVEAALARHHNIDILVNNAGIPATMGLTPFRDTGPADWEPFLDVNLRGVMNCCHAVLAGMRQRHWGRIITISSAAGTAGTGIGVASYGAGKGGGIAFMRNLALEEVGAGITANTIALGLMANDRSGPSSERVARLAGTIPMGRLGTADDAAALCVYLAAEEAAWMTGQTIQLNGGAITT